MIGAEAGRRLHSHLGIVSLVLALVTGVSLVGVYLFVKLAVARQASGVDTAACGFGLLVFTVAAVLREVAALALGVAGTLQRRRKRTLALLGVVCSVLSLVVIHDQVELGHLLRMAVAFFTEPSPKVHSVSP